MEEIIKYLKDKKFDETVSRAMSVCPKLFDSECSEEIMNKSIKHTLMDTIVRDEKLQDMVFKYSVDSTLDKIIEGLDIKIDDSAVPDSDEKLIAIMTLIDKLF